MADVQVEHGYTRLADRLLTALAHAPFDAPSQHRMVLGLIRATYGLHRTEADLGTADWRELTGLADSQVIRARKTLQKEGVLIVVRDFDARRQRPTRWKLRKDFTRWGRFAVDEETVNGVEGGLRKAYPLPTEATPPHGGDSRGQGTEATPDLPTEPTPGTGRKSLSRNDSEAPKESKREEMEEEPSGPSSGEPPNWTAAAGDLWERHMDGVAAYGRIGKALKPLVERHGEDDVLHWWGRYLEEHVATGEGRYASPESFAQRYGAWKQDLNGGAKLTKADRKLMAYRRSIEDVPLNP